MVFLFCLTFAIHCRCFKLYKLCFCYAQWVSTSTLPSRRHRNHLKSRDQQSLTLRSPVVMQGLLFVNFCHQLNWEFVLFIPAPPIVTVSCRTNFQSTMKICFESSDSSYTLNPTYLEHQPTCEDVTTTQDPRTNGFSKGNISEAKSGHKRRVFLRSSGCTIEQSSGPVYTKCQHQCCNNSAMTLAILFSFKEMVSLQNGLATHFRATSLFSMRTVLVASLQSCYGVDAGAWCKWALNRVFCSHWANSSFRLMQVSSRCHSPFLFDKLGIEKRNFLQCAWT